MQCIDEMSLRQVVSWAYCKYQHYFLDEIAIDGRTIILLNLLYCTIIVWMIPKKDSYNGKRPVRPVKYIVACEILGRRARTPFFRCIPHQKGDEMTQTCKTP